ncbi:hypothetical protein LMH73_009150 [Vibrio splendidus]|nr:hypothetical protein [Vibrio splendidus]MCC4880309.1 hypothetical protein [Vibrio splendidus]
MKQGDFCVLNKADDATLYHIQSIKGYTVALVYCSGESVFKPQFVDLDLLKKPTKAQLEHSYNADTVSKFSK